MTNSNLFFRRKASGQQPVKIPYVYFDCCEGLGSQLNEHGAKEAFIGIPNREMDEFFFQADHLEKFLEFVSLIFDIQYSIATKEMVEQLNLDSASGLKDTDTFLRVGHPTNYHNKYFNSSWNFVRYLWYKHYTNIAIMATNMYKLGTFKPIDILAISSSFQSETNRALLPVATTNIPGLLYFRDMDKCIGELRGGQLFNNVFYKYPIYFNPVVEIRGSFFSDSKITIVAKETLSKLASLDSVDELPGSIRASLTAIEKEYSEMKKVYIDMLNTLSKLNLSMNFQDSLLLSPNMKEKRLSLYSPAGSGQYFHFGIKDGSGYVEKESQKDVAPKKVVVEKKEEPTLDF